jgi:ankyrin repeat protein
VLLLLLEAGAQINAQDNEGMTPLMWAAKHNTNPDVVSTLLKAGANGKLTSKEGKTAGAYADENEKLKGTAQYWDLNNARF